ncbi:non-hydrolyzing UDP-N-acetylglucosamine 2-epimerase [Thermithiobacillus plumbiphilus]|uniref:UDP-N-acetylglucosamine 2-epimerase (non-hydrolyzing) n=1 Tax=Thermithiobacillus plumbiphilus TaxID=1729899 RepID=A0ABU9D5Y1_9PROT
MKKVLTVFGTRPEAIKMAPIIRELARRADEFSSFVCVTAQHREMLDQVLDFFQIMPDFDLNIMKKGQDLYDVTSGVLLGIRGVLKQVEPDIVLVHGDTSTSFAAALAAFYAGIKVGHIEAGLRTRNLKAPFPEEANRQLTARLADFHFAPTATSKQNLIFEGIPESRIFVTGNTVIDALFWARNRVMMLPQSVFSSALGRSAEVVESSEKIVLVTGHRRENFGAGFINICEALKEIAQSNPDVHIIYPVHMNENVRKPVYDLLKEVTNVHLVDPLEYSQFVYLMAKSCLIITDSGGIQEEAPSLGKRVLVMRDMTERPEALSTGLVKLVGTNRKKIVTEANKILNSDIGNCLVKEDAKLYGDGRAAFKIVNVINEAEL